MFLYVQKHLGRLLYWGTQGVRRDVNAAVDYYRMGAEAGDLNAMHDYAIVLLKVRIHTLFN